MLILTYSLLLKTSNSNNLWTDFEKSYNHNNINTQLSFSNINTKTFSNPIPPRSRSIRHSIFKLHQQKIIKSRTTWKMYGPWYIGSNYLVRFMGLSRRIDQGGWESLERRGPWVSQISLDPLLSRVCAGCKRRDGGRWVVRE